jgi:hypothetical protein
VGASRGDAMMRAIRRALCFLFEAHRFERTDERVHWAPERWAVVKCAHCGALEYDWAGWRR